MFNIIKNGLLLLIIVALLSGCDKTQPEAYQGYVDGEFTFMAAPFSGIIKHLYTTEGATVKTGDVLFELDRQPQYSELQQAQYDLKSAKDTLEDLKKGERETIIAGISAQIARAEAELALNVIELSRSKTLYEQDAASKQEYDRAKTEYLATQEEIKRLKANLAEANLGNREDVISAQTMRVAAAKAKVQQLQWALAQKTVTTPVDAYVYDRFFKQGEFVPEAQPVLSILSPENLYIIFFVPLPDIHKIHIGKTVMISCDGCKKTYKATIFFISPKIEFTPPVIFSRERNYKYVYRIKARLALAKAFDFHLGQPVEVSLSTQEQKHDSK